MKRRKVGLKEAGGLGGEGRWVMRRQVGYEEETGELRGGGRWVRRRRQVDDGEAKG